MRKLAIVAFVAASLMGGCDRAGETVKSETEAPAALPAPKPAPMTPERLAVCAAALEAWSEAGRGGPPGGVSAEDAKTGATLLGMRRMELSLNDSAGTDKAIAAALAGWQRQTPGDIEAGAAVCLTEIRGG
jgi:hypothetical protein